METKTITVALLQMSSVVGIVEENCNKIRDIINKSNLDNIDVLVLPEVWSVGWDCSYFIESAKYYDYIVNFLSDISKKYCVNIIGGSIISRIGDKYYNTCPIFDKTGNLIANYNKNHLYSYYGCDEDKYVCAGDTPVMVQLDGVNFGITICYDIRFPEIYRAYAKSGADVLVNCAAWGSTKPVPWEMMTKSRAIENQCYMLALTQCGHIAYDAYNLGESRIIDYKGEEMASIMHSEGIISSTLNLSEMYEFRSNSPILQDIKDNYEVKSLCVK